MGLFRRPALFNPDKDINVYVVLTKMSSRFSITCETDASESPENL